MQFQISDLLNTHLQNIPDHLQNTPLRSRSWVLTGRYICNICAELGAKLNQVINDNSTAFKHLHVFVSGANFVH